MKKKKGVKRQSFHGKRGRSDLCMRSWAQMFLFFFNFHVSQAKCLTSPTWLKSLVLTRQSWRRRRQKKRTLCPPKRVSAPYTWWSPITNNFHAACAARITQGSHWWQFLQGAGFHSVSFFASSCSHWAGEEGRCHTLTSEHTMKRRCHCKKKKKHFPLITTVFQSPYFVSWICMASSHRGCLTTRVGKL